MRPTRQKGSANITRLQALLICLRFQTRLNLPLLLRHIVDFLLYRQSLLHLSSASQLFNLRGRAAIKKNNNSQKGKSGIEGRQREREGGERVERGWVRVTTTCCVCFFSRSRCCSSLMVKKDRTMSYQPFIGVVSPRPLL